MARYQTGATVALVAALTGCGLIVGVEDVELATAGGDPGGGEQGGEAQGAGPLGGMGGNGGEGGGVPAVCGNGTQEGDEACDDGNAFDFDACRNNCSLATCGDGVKWEGVEDCDDANDSNEDSCVTGCIAARCGDGFVRAGVEGCDDGNSIDTDACKNNCSLATCGNGTEEAGEVCDDGNPNDDDDCLTTCQSASCGDGHVHATGQLPNEQCDDGNATQTDACKNNCTPNTCGDGYQYVNVEDCDDGNASNSDGCVQGCVLASCGDSFVHNGFEDCDDGNASQNDACLDDCTDNVCGDGFVDPAAEDCDDANSSNTDACLNSCTAASCGDGYVHTGSEVCDDQNLVAHDGCDACDGVIEIVAGEKHTCALISNGNVKCWGDGQDGKLGQGNIGSIGDTAGELATIAPVPLGEPALHLGLGMFHSCAILQSGAMKCWGNNDFGQLGTGASTAPVGDSPGEVAAIVPVSGLLGTPQQVVAGYLTTCVLVSGGQVQCWGLNSVGQNGQGNTVDHYAPGAAVNLGTNAVAVEISSAVHHTCARLSTGAVKCWGDNQNGDCGVELPNPIHIGDGPGELGDSLAAAVSGASAITIGNFASCALIGSNIDCWGNGANGVLGSEDTNAWGDAAGEMSALPGVDLAAPAVSVELGWFHGCAILNGGDLKCWGYGTYTGHGNAVSNGNAPGTMGNNLPITDITSSNDPAIAVTAGANHTCVLLRSRKVKCFGDSADGRLGTGTGSGSAAIIGDGPNEMGDDLPVLALP